MSKVYMLAANAFTARNMSPFATKSTESLSSCLPKSWLLNVQGYHTLRIRTRNMRGSQLHFSFLVPVDTHETNVGPKSPIILQHRIVGLSP